MKIIIAYGMQFCRSSEMCVGDTLATMTSRLSVDIADLFDFT